MRPKETKEPEETKQTREPKKTKQTARGHVKEPSENLPLGGWVVYCNSCDKAMENEHFHCSICEDGDYDLCPTCVDASVHCPGDDHWLVKRFVVDGIVENSTTERIAPKTKVQPEQKKVEAKPEATAKVQDQPKAEQGMPGAFMEEKQPVAVEQPEEEEEADRTCNCCVKGTRFGSYILQPLKLMSTVFSENEFVSCTTCADYDLCLECHVQNKHGHHPGHAFEPATEDTPISALAKILCNAGRNVRHNAVCDGCEKVCHPSPCSDVR